MEQKKFNNFMIQFKEEFIKQKKELEMILLEKIKLQKSCEVIKKEL